MEDVQTSKPALSGSDLHGHLLLQGGRKAAIYSHGFSKPQIKSLAALCDTFIPAVPLPENENDPEAESFYLLSGSQNGIPDQVAEAMVGRLKPIGLKLGKVVLWLLSTRLGTWMLCGSASIKPRFPYLQTFDEVPQPKREQILVNWSRGKSSAILRFVFKLFKICCLFTFYSVADENGENPAWKAIGYSPPQLSPQHKPRPLDKGVLDVTEEKLDSLFKGTGFIVTEEKNYGNRNWRVKCDVVVVGSGSGGGVVASILARAGYRVLVLEKGKYFARDDLTLLEGPSLQHMYESGGLLSSNDGKIIIMAGATVGGGSAINWSASIRTPDHVLKEWANQCDLPFFATQEYQNAMDAVCERLGVQDRCSKESFQNTVLRKGCSKLGLRVDNVARNSTADHFCGSCCFGCPSGNKKGTDETWLVDAVEAGAVILTGCRAEKVLCFANRTGGKKKKRAAGVVATVEGLNGLVFVEATVTVAAAGSLLTPPLLRASGIRNPNIGKNLHLHPVQMAWGYFPENRDPVGKSYEGGIITAICKDPITSDYGTINQTPALAPGSFAAMIPWTSGLDMKQRMRKYCRTAHVFTLLRDRGSGSVMDYMDIDYRIGKSEKEKLRDGLRRAVRILVAGGASEVGTHRSDGQRFVVDGATSDEVEGFLGDVDPARGCGEVWTTTCSAHQMGSCRMGRDERSGAVDWRGETWEVEGLFVGDGSLLPTAVGVNPMITIQSVVYSVSHHILQFLSKNPTS